MVKETASEATTAVNAATMESQEKTGTLSIETM
jgi:hypothetical protein